MVIGALVVVGLAIASLLAMRSPISQPAPFPMEAAEKLSVEQLAEKATEIVLPTWMPGEIKLREIYFKNLAILVYSDKDVRDYRDDDVTIQISKTDYSLTLEEAKEKTSGEVLILKNFWIVLHENPSPGPDMEERGIKPIIAYFWYEGFYYIITVNKDKVTRDDMISIVENMKPVGTDTLRKV